MTITPSTPVVSVGDVLTCSSDGYPVATFEWEDLDTGDTTAGPTLTVTKQGDFFYRCKATTSAHQTQCSKFTSVSFSSIRKNSYFITVTNYKQYDCMINDK